jgi:bifunctional non-homologous end joining protein LigD
MPAPTPSTEPPRLVRPRRATATRPSMPDFVPFQFCKLVSAPPTGDGWMHEVKFDGYRMQVRMSNGQARWRTRNLFDWTDKFGAMSAEVSDLPDGIYDGELCAMDAKGRPNFSTLKSDIQRGALDRLVFFLFDAPWLDGQDLRDLPLSERRRRLSSALEDLDLPPTIRLVEPLPGSGRDLHLSACKMGLEGIVSKRLSAPYRAGKDGSWTKAKCRPALEVVIGGWKTEGSRFTGLLTGVYRDGQFVYSGSVGTGFTAKTMSELLPKLGAARSDVSPYASGAPRKTSDIHWVKPILVANVEIAEWTNSGKLRQASYKGLREDKDPREVVFEMLE